MADWLLPFQLPFMQQAFAIAIIVCIPMALLSCYLVLQGWSLMGDAISHAVFPGVVIAYLIGIPLAIGAFITGMICAVGSGFLNANSRVKEDTVLGVVFSGMFAFGLVLYVAIQTDVHLDHILYGNMLGVSWAEVGYATLAAAAVAAFVVALRRDLLLNAFDPQQARAIGLPVNFLHYGLLSAIALSVVTALTAVGIILSIAFLVTPGATAHLLTRRFGPMLAVAVGVGTVSTVAGTYLSFYLDSAPAPTIVLVMTVIFIAAFAHSQGFNRKTA